MLENLWDKELQKNFAGTVKASQKTCADCEHGFKCQTGTFQQVFVTTQEPMPGWGNNGGVCHSYTRNEPVLFFLNKCTRPLGMLRLVNADVDTKFEYMWITPFVPVQVKLDMLGELAKWHLKYLRLETDPDSQAIRETAVNVILEAGELWRQGYRGIAGRRQLENKNLARNMPYLFGDETRDALVGFYALAFQVFTGAIWDWDMSKNEPFAQDCYKAALASAGTRCYSYDDAIKNEQGGKQRQIGEFIKCMVNYPVN